MRPISVAILSLLLVPICTLAQVKPNISGADLSATQLKAKKIYERLTGAKIAADNPLIGQMTELLNAGNALGAAQIATQNPKFYNITVKLMALKLSTREETIKISLNDFAASFIGVTRDQRDARELLTGNFYYRGSGDGVRVNLNNDILLSNNHYEDLDSRKINLAVNLQRVEGQMIANSAGGAVANPDPAGVLTSRAFMGAHAVAGTNRRPVEFTFREFMCVPLEQWADTNAADSRIGRDIDRFPAGDHMKFLTSCKGCHTVMDGFRGAFAKWDFNNSGGIKHSAVSPRGDGNGFSIDADERGIIRKLNRNESVFPSGYVTTDDSFVNNAVRSANINMFGWRGEAASGTGVKDFARIVANSRRFSQCMAKRVFETVCRKNMDMNTNRAALVKWGDEFEASGYNLKKLFENVAVKPECLN